MLGRSLVSDRTSIELPVRPYSRMESGKPIRTSRPGSPRTITLPTIARPLKAPIDPLLDVDPSAAILAVPDEAESSNKI